jgi:hypothetical membrane protein
VYNFFCIISGIFCVPFLYMPLRRCYWWHCPLATAFILVSVLLVKISVPNEGTDGNVVWSGRIFFSFIPWTICSNVLWNVLLWEAELRKYFSTKSELEVKNWCEQCTITIPSKNILAIAWLEG